MKKLFVLSVALPAVIFGYYALRAENSALPDYLESAPEATATTTSAQTVQKPAGERMQPAALPVQKVLESNYHIFQSFNNCAPAALSMGLSYYGVRASQEKLMAELRPFNNPQGKNDDKSTPPDELAAKAREYGLIPYYRGGGDIERIKKFIAAGIPVIVRTLLYPDKDYAHYRVIKGYDDMSKQIIQDDSLEGKNLRFTYEKWNHLWKPFNYAYLVLARSDQQAAVEAILGEDLDERLSWQKAAARAEAAITQNPADTKALFNLSVARYYTGEYQKSIEAFEKAEPTLARLYIWYQVEPIRSYFELAKYDRVFDLTSKIITPTNAAWTELYMLRGESYLKLGEREKAKTEFEKAVYYNVNYKPAQDALAAFESRSE